MEYAKCTAGKLNVEYAKMTQRQNMADETKPPSPGSDDAVNAGCTCPVLDNAHGRGYLGSGRFWITDGCPVHMRIDTAKSGDVPA